MEKDNSGLKRAAKVWRESPSQEIMPTDRANDWLVVNQLARGPKPWSKPHAAAMKNQMVQI